MPESKTVKERTCKACATVIVGTATDMKVHAQHHCEQQTEPAIDTDYSPNGPWGNW